MASREQSEQPGRQRISLLPGALLEHGLWWQGPQWLTAAEVTWEATIPKCSEEMPEQQRAVVHAVTTKPDEPSLVTRFSSLLRLPRISVWCTRWRRRRATHEQVTLLVLSAEEIDAMHKHWIRVAQDVAYPAEITALNSGQPLSLRSAFRKLAPFIDNTGILRVGGRLKHSVLSFDERPYDPACGVAPDKTANSE